MHIGFFNFIVIFGRKSSKIKSKLYKNWLQTKDQQDETKYMCVLHVAATRLL